MERKAKILGIRLIDFSQFPGYLESKKKRQLKHGFGTSFFGDPVL